MQKAQPDGKGAMAAVLGLDENTLKQICESIEKFYVDLANLNCPGQIVISGEAEGIKRASELAKQKGAKKGCSSPGKYSFPLYAYERSGKGV